MKKAIVIAFVLCLCAAAFPVFDKDKPAATTSLRNSNPEILTNWSDLQTALNQDHEFVNAASGQQSGEHTQVKFFAPISTPSNAANKAFLYSKDVDSVVELHWEDESGNEVQMTSLGGLFSSASLTVTASATFNGGITLGAGDTFQGSSTSDILFNVDKFTVLGSNGNTAVGGTLVVAGVTTLSGNLAATTMSGALAMGSNKITGLASGTTSGDALHRGQYAPVSYAGGESITFPNGFIMKSGISGSISGNSQATITFNVAFPNAVISVTVTKTESVTTRESAWSTKTVGTSSFVIVNHDGAADEFYWMVIGH